MPGSEGGSRKQWVLGRLEYGLQTTTIENARVAGPGYLGKQAGTHSGHCVHPAGDDCEWRMI